jgi:hypothetical protein
MLRLCADVARPRGASSFFRAPPPPLPHSTRRPFQQARFQAMSDAIITKIDEMGGRIDELERNISELMTGMAGGAQGAGVAAGGAAAVSGGDGR